MIRARILAPVLVAAAVLAPRPATAQVPEVRPGPFEAAAAERNESVAAEIASLFAPVSAASVLDTAPRHDLAGATTSYRPALPTPQARDRGGVPYMVAGGVLFVAGAIAGGDGGTLLMIGGAGFGAYGAYVYFGGD